MNKVLAVIPARGGSKRIPRKNIIDFKGKPLIAYTIEAALKSHLFDDVLVSTDDEEIAEVSRKLGAFLPFLRREKADDYSNVSEVTIHVLEQLERRLGKTYDSVALLLPNCPLRDYHIILDAFNQFHTKNRKFQISAFKYGWMNPWWAHTIDGEKAQKVFTQTTTKRSQDLPEAYCPTGAIWIAKVEELKKANTFYGPDYSFFQMNWKKAVDIDDYEDLEMAKIIFELLKND